MDFAENGAMPWWTAYYTRRTQRAGKIRDRRIHDDAIRHINPLGRIEELEMTDATITVVIVMVTRARIRGEGSRSDGTAIPQDGVKETRNTTGPSLLAHLVRLWCLTPIARLQLGRMLLPDARLLAQLMRLGDLRQR